ncbi:MAG: TraR/DksA C4-type zinc finger protein [Micromonosporaceae bacterium]|nr:TraR/DksA C4-type zinc finger protein [Micromonosporaceae bacterium]
MSTLDTKDHDDWLAGIRERLQQTSELHSAQLLDLTATTADPADPATHAALLSATRQSLADVTEALRRIEQGTYGQCEACGQAIPPERLEIIPHARTCVACSR